MSEVVAQKPESARARALRLLPRQKVRSRVIRFEIDEEVIEAEVRSPDLQGRRAMANAHRDDPAKQNMYGIIMNTYELGELRSDGTRAPGTKRLFDVADMDVLMQDPSGGFIDVLSHALGEMLKEDVETAQANSKK